VQRRVVQRCPNCSAKYDVGIYVSGQKVRCSRCGIKFAVQRTDTQVPQPAQAVNAGATGVLGGPQMIAVGDKPALRVDAPLEAIAPPQAAPPDPPPQKPRNDQKGRISDVDLPAGTVLKGYEIGTILGKGAMGTVYRARQLSLDRTVAVKVMSSDLVTQPEFILRFRREAAALAALAHTNVVSIIDQGNVDAYWFFVMEYVDGPTLRRLLSQRNMRLSKSFDLAVQIGRGLDYAHGKGVVHRDLKPENVLLADDGANGHIAKICDFGLADILYSDRSYVNLTGSRISMGTVNYMAPEQRQDAGRVDARADVFSYGVVLYEMLTGELPIGRYQEPSKRNRSLDRRLDEVILRALEPDARRRYPRVREIVEVLETVRRSAA
jgi:serine/threonine-protein kinase